jgi:hypothetical protein
MLSKQGTIKFLQRGPAALDITPGRVTKDYERSHAGGGLLVVTRAAFDAVGGYDESYQGWGYEDSDMNLRLLRTVGWDRLPGWAWHLWHGREDNTPRPESKRAYPRLLKEYRKDIFGWGMDKGLAHPERVF